MRDKRKLSSIHARLLLTTLIPLTLLSLILGWYIVTSQRAVLLSNLHDTGRVAAQQMASNAEFALFSGNQSMLETLGYSVLDIPSVSGIVFYNEIDESTVRIGTESESDIKYYNSHYKNTKKNKTISKKTKFFERFWKISKSKNFKNSIFYLAFSTRSIIQSSKFKIQNSTAAAVEF